MSEWEQILAEMKQSTSDKSWNNSNGSNPGNLTTKAYGNECPICHGRGWVLKIGEDGNEYADECECGLVEQSRQDSKLRFAAIPETYKNVTFKDMTTKYYTKSDSKNIIKAAMELVKWYLDNLDGNVESGKGIYLWSETKGSGKTMLITALANELINKHKRYVKFATSLDILGEIRATYDKRSEETESRLLKDLADTEFLVIDDFGTERITDWVGYMFYQIINNRYINKKVTFFTSNSDLKTLKYDDRITNRIRERSYLVHFPEESVREFKAKADEVKLQGIKSRTD